MTFNRETRRLAIIDNDQWEDDLPTLTVTAKDYKVDGVRDDNGNLTHNQVLVIDDVFSGGQSNEGKVSRDPNSSQQKAIPEGKYDLVDNDADTRHDGWYRMDANRYNDKDDATGRDGFRFHLGTLSWGCVTCDNSVSDRKEEWNVVEDILKSTSTTTVKEEDRGTTHFLG